MTLWHLLLGICFAMPLAAAIDTAGQSKGGLGSYIVAIPIGLSMGCGFACAMWIGGRRAGTRINEQPVSRQEWYFGGLYFSAVVWAIAAALVSHWLLTVVMRRMF